LIANVVLIGVAVGERDNIATVMANVVLICVAVGERDNIATVIANVVLILWQYCPFPLQPSFAFLQKEIKFNNKIA
jgi:hypothetical protein